MRFIERVAAAAQGIPTLALTCTLILSAGPAFALTKEAAVERCRMTVGRAIVQAGMRAGGCSIEAARSKTTPPAVGDGGAGLNAGHGRDNDAGALSTEPA